MHSYVYHGTIITHIMSQNVGFVVNFYIHRCFMEIQLQKPCDVWCDVVVSLLVSSLAIFYVVDSLLVRYDVVAISLAIFYVVVSLLVRYDVLAN